MTQLVLGSLLRSLGLKPNEDQVETLIQAADKNNNGIIEFSEFISLASPDLIPTKCPIRHSKLFDIEIFFVFEEI